MSQHCDVCQAEIPSVDDTLAHVKLHQAQLLALTNRLHLEAAPCRCDVSADEASQLDGSIDSDKGEWSHGLAGQSSSQGKARDKALKCPVRQCARKRFTRKQELVRHYATHYEICRVCPGCSNTFTKASTFGTHQCGASDWERGLIRATYKEIRHQIEVLLGFRPDTRPLAQSVGEPWPPAPTEGQARLRAAPPAQLHEAAAGQGLLSRPDLGAFDQPVMDGSAELYSFWGPVPLTDATYLNALDFNNAYPLQGQGARGPGKQA